MALNIITAKFCSGATQAWASDAWQYDYGQVLQFDGIDLPEAYQVHFSNEPMTGETITQIGNADGVSVPDQFFQNGDPIFAWVYLHEGEDDGETVYMVTIPIKKRSQPSDEVPTPVEQSAIDQAIAALNIAVEKADEAITHYPTIIDGTWHVWDVTTGAYADTGVEAKGDNGISPTVTVTDITNGHRVTITDADGTKTFDVLNGDPGADGVSPTVTVTEITGGHRVVITDASGEHTFDVMNGEGGSAITVDSAMSSTSENPVQNKVIDAEITGLKEDLNQVVENGYYTTETFTEYISMTRGQINNNGAITINQNTAYCYLTAEQETKSIQFDASQYKYNIAYFNGETVVSYTGWIESSPIIIDSTIAHTSIGINLRKLSGTVPTDLSELLWYEDGGDAVGNLATKDYAVAKQQDVSNAGKPLVVGDDGIVAPGEIESDKGRLCIYPDGFESRIKPDIYFKDGKFYADIDLEAYKISGSAVYVSTSGSDTSGNGTKEKPYATITKALTTTAKTIYLEEGTYIQGTHFGTYARISERNLIGIGNVVLQGDSSGHYMTADGNFYCENVKFISGNSGVATHAFYCGLTDETTYCFVDCEFSGAGANGLGAVGGNHILFNCKAYGNKLDGFNYHDYTSSATGVTSVPHVLEMDCKAYNNGSAESGSDSCNGSTAHDGARVIRLNGEYYNCYGGVIAEIARTTEGAPQTISVNYGVLAHDSTIPSSAKGASFWVSYNTKMYLYNCQCYGSDYDLSAENTGMIISRQLITGRDVPSVYKGTNAQIYQY